MGLAGLVQCHRAAEDNKKHDGVGEKATYGHIDFTVCYLLLSAAVKPGFQFAPFGFLFLDLLRCLPEKQIGTDRGAKDRDTNSPRFASVGQRWREGVAQHG